MCIHRVYCSYIQPTIGNRLFMLVVSLSQESLMKEKFSLKHIMVYFPKKGSPTNRLSTNQPFVDIECPKDRLRRGYWGYTHPTFSRNPNNWYINPYYWVDDHPPLYGNNGSLDPGTYETHAHSLRNTNSTLNDRWRCERLIFFCTPIIREHDPIWLIWLLIFFKCVAQRPS